MNSGLLRILLLSLALGAPAGAAEGDDLTAAATVEKSITGTAGVALGVKILDSGWEPLGDQTVSIISLTIGNGYWADTGFRQGAGRWWEWGIDLRYSKGEVNLGSGDVEAGGPQALFYFGGAW